MKKLIVGFILAAFVAPMIAAPVLQARHGSGIAAGIAAGTFAGLATSAIVSSSNRSRADREVEELRREQQRDRIDQIERQVDRRELAKKDQELAQMAERLRQLEGQQSKPLGSNTYGIMVAMMILLIIAVFGLGVVVLKK